jgi:hypothetical protein
MGFEIVCENVSFSCGYSTWMVIREEIANASLRYLRKVYDDMLVVNDTQTAEQTFMEQLLEYIDLSGCETMPDFLRLFSDVDFLNTFIYHRVSGVFALLNKSDTDGFYSVGNSMDIVETMDILREYICYDDVKAMYGRIREVFTESIRAKNLVVII